MQTWLSTEDGLNRFDVLPYPANGMEQKSGLFGAAPVGETRSINVGRS
jgi:hypothetical protein